MGKEKGRYYRHHVESKRKKFDRKFEEKADKVDQKSEGQPDNAHAEAANTSSNKENNDELPKSVPEGTRPSFHSKKIKHGVDVHIYDCDVAITEYLNDHQGFQAVIKARFSDFHVHEIDLSNRVLRLDDLTVPVRNELKLSDEQFQQLRESFSNLIDNEMWSKIEEKAKFLEESNGNVDNSTFKIDVTEFDKVQRTNLHTILKRKYGKLTSSTECSVTKGDNDVSVTRKFINVIRGPRNRDRESWSYPGEYVHFLIYKEHMDSGEAASKLASRLRIKPSNVSFCGAKDKRAKTTQKFCVRKIAPQSIASAANHIIGLKAGNFEFSDKVLKLGQLKGNHFRIALRYVMGDKTLIEEALTKVSTNGFINYFGLQRFGNSSVVPTYEVGIALLKSDYKLACELIMKPREGDSPFMNNIRTKWWTDRVAAEVLKLFHQNNKSIEKTLLEGLVQYGQHAYSTALRKIPRNSIQLYIHSFQSLIFNRIVSRRFKEFGMKPIVGDLVYNNRDTDGDVEQTDDNITDDKLDDDCNISQENTDDTNNDVITESIFKSKVRPLTESDLEEGLYTIYDVVYPLPGHDIAYPANACGEMYNEILSNYGITISDLKHKVKLYSMPGAYRFIVIRPTNMSWEFTKHLDSNDRLIKSDLELYYEKEKKTGSFINNRVQSDDEQLEEDTAKKFLALLLNFNLPSSAYATMLLRELMKAESSSGYQANLEKRMRAEAENTATQSTETNVTT